MAKKIYTLEELNVLCAKYQKLLGLQDWEVEICFTNQMTLPDYEAQVATESKSKRALISIISPDTFASSMNHEQDMHHSLIHELLHLHFVAYFRPQQGSVEERLFELALNKIAKAISNLDKAPLALGLHEQTILEAASTAEERLNAKSEEQEQLQSDESTHERGIGSTCDSTKR